MGLPLELPWPGSARSGAQPGVCQRGRRDAAGATLGGLPLARSVTGQKTGTFQRRFTKKHQDPGVFFLFFDPSMVIKWSGTQKIDFHLGFSLFFLDLVRDFIPFFLSKKKRDFWRNFITPRSQVGSLQEQDGDADGDQDASQSGHGGKVHGFSPQNA